MSDSHLNHALKAIDRVIAGETGDSVESEILDFKEDPTRRGSKGQRLSGEERSDVAARRLADASVCLANGEGGALVIGVDDKTAGPGALIGTGLDAAWLAGRIGELTSPRLVVSVKEARVGDQQVRLLVLVIPRNPGPEPHSASVSRKGGRRVSRRVGTSCHEMTTVAEMIVWAQQRGDLDWSALPSGSEIADARAAAVDVMRDFLRDSGEPGRIELAELDDEALIRRLQLVRPEGTVLTRAGELLLCPAESPRIVYLHRTQAGVPSSVRREAKGRGLLEEVNGVLTAIDSMNPVIEIESDSSVTRGFVEAIPGRAIREAVVNAVMHRDWSVPEPITVDHVGTELIVFSPGKFVGGITAATVLTAPSRTRNRLLGDVLRSLRLAEREGTGVDRMYVEMVRLGHRPPTFAERDGGVRVSLHGGEPVREVLAAHDLIPSGLRTTARIAVLVDLLRRQPSVTLAEFAEAAQEAPEDLEGFVAEVTAAEVLAPTSNPRPGGDAAWRLAEELRGRLGPVLPYYARPLEESIVQIAAVVEQQGAIRNSDVQDLLGVGSARASQLLAAAEKRGVIALGPDAKRRGRGTYFVKAPEN